MGFGGGGNTTISTEDPKILNFRIQTSAYGLVVPVVWGTSRVSANLLDYDNFTAIPHTTTTSSGGGGGKGGGGGEVTSTHTSYTYTAAVILGLCHGPISGVGTVWSDKDKVSLGTVGSLFTGTQAQNPWSFMSTYHPDRALAYRGIAYVANSAIDLGSSGSLPQLSFEIQGRGIYGGGIYDCRPVTVLTDILTNPQFGIAFPADSIASLTDYDNYCIASSFFVSPAITDQKPAHEIITQLLQATNSELVWSEGKIKIVPYGDAPVSSPYGSWTPNLTPIYDLTEDDFCPPSGEAPVRVIRKSPADAFNQVQVEYLSRSNEYNVTTVEAKDQANIELYGLRAKPMESMHMICMDSMATKVADLILRRNLYIRNEFEFELSWRYCCLEPMDIVTLTDSQLGLNRQMVRIIEVSEDEYGTLLVRAEEMPGVTATAASHSSQSTSGKSIDFNTDPGNAHPPVFFEPPLSLSDQPEVWMAISGGAQFGGCEVWVSTDNSHYSRLGIHVGNSKHGVTVANLPAGTDPDTTNTLKVDLSVSNGSLLGGTQLDRDLFNTLSYVGGELISYQNANLTGVNTYDLTSLRRGAYGTNISSHPSGSTFVRCDETLFRMPYDPSYKGKTLYIKLRAFNIYGGALQDLSALTAYSYTIQGAEMGAVTGLALEEPWSAPDCRIKWDAMAHCDWYEIEVWHSGTLMATHKSSDARFTYTFARNRADGGPWRSVTFKVYGVVAGQRSANPATLTANNPQIGAPGGLAWAPVIDGINISWEKPSGLDYAGSMVVVSDTAGFDPNALTPVYDGPDTFFMVAGLTAGTPYYVRVGCYDCFGKDGITWSTEFSATPRGIATDPATMLAEINSLLTDGSGTDKIELLADRFSIKSPTGDKIPFGLVEVEAGVWKAMLNADVLIGGNLSVANLSSGALPNDVIFSLGGGVVQLDGAGEVRCYAGPGSNQDFVSLTAAQLLFKQYIAGTGYVTYNYLSRIEAGIANNNDTVVIPGYWKEQPRVMVSPASLSLYKTAYANQDQSVQCHAQSLQEVTPGSGRWQFTAVATLTISANTGTTAINVGSGDISANSWTSSTYTTPANCVSITPSVSVKSQRGNGASQWYYRSIRWRVEYWSGSAWVPLAWRVVNMGAQFNAITDSGEFTFPSAAAWQWRIYAEQYDTDGTVFGAITYEYATDSRTGSFSNQSPANPTGALDSPKTLTVTATFAAYSPPPGWAVYQIDYSCSWSLTLGYGSSSLNSINEACRAICYYNSNVQFHDSGYYRYGGTWYNTSGGAPVLSGNHNISVATTALATGYYKMTLSEIWVTANNTYGTISGSMTASATIRIRRPVANSTTPVNNTYINSYGYTLAAAQVLAAGTLNWIAMGR